MKIGDALSAAFLALAVFIGPQRTLGAEGPGLQAASDPETFSGPAQLVAVEGGRRLNMRCMGSGAPTVVLEAGATHESTVWWKVQGKIAAFTRVCAYDRAGYGFSDASERPSTAANAVDDLHRLLAAAGVPLPVVLVGHSAGGLYATLYADKHLTDVAGMVLVDPAFAGQLQQAFAVYKPEERAKLKPLQDTNRAKLTTCASSARSGDREALATNNCSYLPPDLPEAVQQQLAEQFLQPKYYDTMLAEGIALNGDVDSLPTENDRQEMAAARSFGAMPLLVLTNGRGIRSAILSAETNAAASAVWRAGHERLARRSSIGRSIVVPDTGHMIQFDQPDAVVGAVREVVDAVRGRASR